MDIQDRITQCWNSAARGYDGRPGHGLLGDRDRLAWLEVLRPVLPAQPGDVLDAGTGTGFLAFRAHELGHRATGVDLSDGMLRAGYEAAAQMAGGPSFLLGDAVRPPFRPASFDALTNRHLLWTLRDPEQALTSWRELLRPGGRLIVIDILLSQAQNVPENPFYTDEVVARLPVMNAKAVGEVVELVSSAGFVDVAEIDLSAVDEAEGDLEETKGRYGLVATRAD